MDTIAAIATPLVPSAVGILRLSGPDAFSLASHLFQPLSGRPLGEIPGHRLVYGRLYTQDDVLLDQCLAAVFRAPASYTGEDCVELQCHGSPMVLTSALQGLLSLGARLAEPGEFTRRAFLNGRMDLTQAEAVADLIEAETAAAACSAAGQLDGAISRTVSSLYESLLETEAHFQAVVDYPDEDLDPFDVEELDRKMRSATAQLSALSDTFTRGRYLKEGITCALVGRPNVGKSSLLNALAGYERAIVTDLPGTTRDTVSETVILAGLPVRLIDTAGIRSTQDRIEQLGVARSMEAARSAQLVLYLLDGGQPPVPEDYTLLEQLQGTTLLILINKTDLPLSICPESLTSYGQVLFISAQTGDGLAALEKAVADRFSPGDACRSGELLTSARQADAVSRAADALRRGTEALCHGVTPDAVLLDVEQALSALGEVTGKNLPEDLLTSIFSRFCVGK